MGLGNVPLLVHMPPHMCTCISGYSGLHCTSSLALFNGSVQSHVKWSGPLLVPKDTNILLNGCFRNMILKFGAHTYSLHLTCCFRNVNLKFGFHNYPLHPTQIIMTLHKKLFFLSIFFYNFVVVTKYPGT